MLNRTYLRHLLIAASLCLALVAFLTVNGRNINYYAELFSFMFGAAFMSLVTIRLPVFSAHYNQDALNRQTRLTSSFAEMKAAAAMSSLTTWGVTAGVLWLAGLERPLEASFCAAVSAGVISFHYSR